VTTLWKAVSGVCKVNLEGGILISWTDSGLRIGSEGARICEVHDIFYK